jgi:rubredoxin
MKFICTLCNYILEEDQGLPAAGIEPGTKFEQLPEDWSCPDCAAKREFFQGCSCVSLPLFEATKVAPTINQIEAA